MAIDAPEPGGSAAAANEEDDEWSSLSHAAYRAYRGVERVGTEPVRFVDGSLLERFLDLPAAVQESMATELANVVQGTAGGGGPAGGNVLGVNELREMVEGLKRMH